MPILSWFQVAALVLPLCVAVDAAAQGAPQPIFSGSDPHWKQISKADCLIYDPIPQPGETVDWSGQCVGRVASGPGVITWKDATGRVTGTTKGTVTNGVEQGLDESKAISTDGGTVKIQIAGQHQCRRCFAVSAFGF